AFRASVFRNVMRKTRGLEPARRPCRTRVTNPRPPSLIPELRRGKLMSKLWMLVIIASGLVGLGLAALAFGIGQESRLLPDNRIPEFAMKALAAPTASKAGLFISKDGAITRYAVHLGREDVPVYLHSMADEKIGKGEDIAYEAEIYPDGGEVYEIYRRVDGKEKQLSILHRDRSVKYVGTQ